jgi:acetoin utilization protein AcuB
VYEKFFESGEKDFEAFLQKPVSDFAYMKVEPVKDTLFIEEAADIFLNQQVRFLPVVNDFGKFLGIVTQKALFRVITKVYGLEDAKIVIHSDDFAGTLLKISDVIYKHGANITNIAQMDTEVMGIQEISIRLVGDNLEKLPEKLQAKGIKVKEFIPAKNK